MSCDKWPQKPTAMAGMLGRSLQGLQTHDRHIPLGLAVCWCSPVLRSSPLTSFTPPPPNLHTPHSPPLPSCLHTPHSLSLYFMFTAVHWQSGDQSSVQQTGHYHCDEENQSEWVQGHNTGCVCVPVWADLMMTSFLLRMGDPVVMHFPVTPCLLQQVHVCV